MITHLIYVQLTNLPKFSSDMYIHNSKSNAYADFLNVFCVFLFLFYFIRPFVFLLSVLTSSYISFPFPTAVRIETAPIC